MLGDFTIRVATPRDEAPISELLEASYSSLLASAYEGPVLAAVLPSMTRANPDLLSSDTYFVAETDAGLVTGCGGWTRERPGTGDLEPTLGHIRHFATHPDWVGCSIGRSIYALCEVQARSAGVQRLECYASLNAEGFYAALGFEPIRSLEVPMGDGVSFPAVLMARSI